MSNLIQDLRMFTSEHRDVKLRVVASRYNNTMGMEVVHNHSYSEKEFFIKEGRIKLVEYRGVQEPDHNFEFDASKFKLLSSGSGYRYYIGDDSDEVKSVTICVI